MKSDAVKMTVLSSLLTLLGRMVTLMLLIQGRLIMVSFLFNQKSQLTTIGAPVTLSQAQSFIKQSPLGPRITFHSASPEDFLCTLPPNHKHYDFIILSHSIYYFSNPTILPSLLKSLQPHGTHVCIAEWCYVPPTRIRIPMFSPRFSGVSWRASWMLKAMGMSGLFFR